MLSNVKLKSFFSIFSVLYLIVGVAFFIVLVQSVFTLFNVGLLAALNLVASYGLNKKEKWAIYLVAWLSLIGIVFGFTIIFTIFQLPDLGLMGIALLLAMALYVTFSVVSFFFATFRKSKFG
ncbi:MAG: hypothetical protein V1850_02125 [Candidatus Bathyarchaeota archaeon]